MECRAGTVVVLRPEPPLVIFDDGTAYRQTDPHAAFVRREERAEELFHHRGIDAATAVANRHAYFPVGVHCGRERQLSRTLLHSLHGLSRIENEIEEDLLQLNPV